MARKSPTNPSPVRADDPPAVAGLPFDPIARCAPTIAAAFEAWARTVCGAEHSQSHRLATLSTLSPSLQGLARMFSQARTTDDLSTLASCPQQVPMEHFGTRQENLSLNWKQAQQELTTLMSSLADRGVLATTADQVDGRSPESPMTALVDQARPSPEQWTRDWTAVVRAAVAVQ
jgi:hypothetical protein